MEQSQKGFSTIRMDLLYSLFPPVLFTVIVQSANANDGSARQRPAMEQGRFILPRLPSGSWQRTVDSKLVLSGSGGVSPFVMSNLRWSRGFQQSWTKTYYPSANVTLYYHWLLFEHNKRTYFFRAPGFKTVKSSVADAAPDWISIQQGSWNQVPNPGGQKGPTKI